MKKIEPMYCKECGESGMPFSLTPGSIYLEFALYLCFFIPGLVYSVWRLAGRGPACPHCKIKNGMISARSPMAKRLMTKEQLFDLDHAENFLARENK